MIDDSRCEYYDACATTGYWENEKRGYIERVCKTKEHENCTHRAGLEALFESDETGKEMERVRMFFQKRKVPNALEGTKIHLKRIK